MKQYAPDTNAAAVILADYGNVFFRARGGLVFDRHTRIKILAEAGYDWGTVTIPYLDKKRAQRIRKVKGQTYTVAQDGTVERHKMDKKSIFTEDIDRAWKQIRFTLPSLQPGAVIEYSYRMEWDDPRSLPTWTFQRGEPTLWSEYRAEIPDVLNFVIATVGVFGFSRQETEPVNSTMGGSIWHRWVMEEVPALREEPFMTTPKNYRATLQFQLQSISHPSFGTIEYLSSWDELAKELMEMSSFGKQLRPPNRGIK